MNNAAAPFTFGVIDIAVFVGFYLIILATSLWKSRSEKGSAGYFLGGRSLPWWLIGVSVVAANLSTEQFVGMAGQAAGNVGLAVSCWQLTGIVGLILAGFFFLPKFLAAGIYTMPEYLEYRYNKLARVIMTFVTVITYVTVSTAAVLYSGAITLESIFGIPLMVSIFVIAGISLLYVVWGGLLAAVWADLFQGTALLIGGLIAIGLGVYAIGGWEVFVEKGADKLHLILPREHKELPWTVLIGGMWIPIIYYCGLNQFIMQRTLAAKNLREGQLGIIFAGALWLLVPVAVVMPGIAAAILYPEQMQTTDMAGNIVMKYDSAYPLLVKNLVPVGLRGFILAALAGAVISSLASILNSASTIFTMDIYKQYIAKGADEKLQVRVGRISTIVFMAIACVIALSPLLQGGVFKFIQEFQGYISPGIVAAFVFGFIVKRAPSQAGVSALIGSPVIYGLLQYFCSDVPYLHRMLWTLGILVVVMGVLTLIAPLEKPKVMPVCSEIETRTSPGVVALGLLVIAAVIGFFVYFR
jgi:solute:Na+ symporter, SSS family